VKRRYRVLAGYLLVEAAALCLVAAAIWGFFQSPRLRYRVWGDEASLRAVLRTLHRGDSVEEVQALLGDRYLDPESEFSVRQGLRKLVETYPEIFVQGYEETDTVLVYSTRTFRYGLQFRDGALVGTCGQQGPRILPPGEPDARQE